MMRFGFEIEATEATAPLIRQVHGDVIAAFENAEAFERARRTPQAADGAMTPLSDQALYVFTADCLPLLFATPRSIAAVHCGWRGALAGIARNAVERLNAIPEEIRLVVGPSIGPCCFEVKEDLLDAFRKAGRPVDSFVVRRRGSLFCDLLGFVRQSDLPQILPRQIDLTHWRCTHCSSPALPSYRREKATPHRLRSWILREGSAKAQVE